MKNSSQNKQAYDVLNQIYKEINKKSSSHEVKLQSQFSLSEREDSQYNEKKIMDGFIEKLVNRFNFENEVEMTNQNEILNSNLFKNFSEKICEDDKRQFAKNSENNFNDYFNTQNNLLTNKEDEDLPHFGQSAKKSKNENNVSMQMNNSIDEILTGNEIIQTLQSAQTNENLDTKAFRDYTQGNNMINPNNTLKNDSNFEDDSLFADGENSTNRDKINFKFSASSGLENMIKNNVNTNLFSIVNTRNSNPDQSSFFQNTQSMMLNPNDESNQNSMLDEYVDDDDPGFDLYECEQEYFKETCAKLSEQYDFPRRAILHSKFKNYETFGKDYRAESQTQLTGGGQIIRSIKMNDNDQVFKKSAKGEKLYEINNIEPSPTNTQFALSPHSLQSIQSQQAKVINNSSLLPPNVKFMDSGNSYYPVQYGNVIYDCFNLKIIVDRERTGFEESKDFKVVVNSLIASRYQVLEYLGSAAFSKAIKCLDILENRVVCLKIIENNKDYVDQSIDEIKLLRYINANGDADEKNFLRLYDYFYHKEHLFIVTEILKDNLYEFYKYLNDNSMAKYFTLKRLQNITKQILTCLDFLHSLKIIHCDLKPENILMKSITDTTVKVIDFGSSCFIHDHLSTYVQSRSYRAPEVILGCKYDYKVDMWSLGCILAELFTGNVLFQNDSVQSLLARVRKLNN
jgi:hypothetical protein